MEQTWNVEQVWGSDRFYYEGDVASNEIAFVIDSGIALLDDLNVNLEWSKSFVNETENPFDDQTGHGTAVASIIGAKANEVGLTGVAPGAELVSLKVFGSNGSTFNNIVNAALEYARDVIVANNLFDRAVVNMSLGSGAPNRHPLVEEMANMGIKFAVAAGNRGKDVDGHSPASYGDLENVYVASSNTESGDYSNFTNFDGLDIDGKDDSDFSAPGSRVPTYNTDGTIGYRNGTSFSAPHLAGVLLMSEEVRPGQTFDMNGDQIEKGMIPDPLGMFDPYTYKHGLSVGDPIPSPEPEEPVEPPVLGPQDDRVNLRGDQFDNILNGGDNRDKLRGAKGNDSIFSYEGNDVVRGGKGDDFMDAGTGADVITGGFGLNTFADQRDGDVDILFTSADGLADEYQGLDEFDTVFIKGAYSSQLTFSQTDGGIGVYFDEVLEGLYTGNTLTVDQFSDMVLGLV